ncbi:ABC transporter permease [Egicoccus sp. AB-alg2]|uniref:ABC transporter permease n=1 Tax=Egicoccus sp. AB-alg2 TaxID=3242693 RepID=UPI00359DD7E5
MSAAISAVHLLASETRKLRTVATTWVLTAIGWGLVVLSALLPYLIPAMGSPFTGSAEQVASTIDAIGANSIIVMIVGILVVTTEFRHGTIGRTLQLVPSRMRVLGAKLAAGIVYSLAFVLTSLVIVTVILFAMSIAGDAPLHWGAPVGTALWQAFAGLALTSVLGVAVGALIRSQVIAITVSLIWIFVVEQLVFGLRPSAGQWLPFQALNSVFLTAETRAQMPPNAQFLEPGVALAAFLGYVVVFTVVAAVLMRARDV